MIVPGDYSEISLKPSFKLSWVIVSLNVLFYVFSIFSYDSWPSAELTEKIIDENFKKTVVEMYAQTLDPLEKISRNGSEDRMYSWALKDETFWQRVQTFPFVGDQVQIEDARSFFSKFVSTYHKSAQFQYGLGNSEVSPWSWITYQFVHASFIHLLGNMFIIMLCLSFLEKFVSIGWIAFIYLASGIVGGVFFLGFDSAGSMSVVGASASASGLLGFLLLSRHSRSIPWFYIFAPIKGGYGKIYLPSFFIFPIFLVTDFLSLLWEPNGVASNIAVSAHVGGALCGMALGLMHLLFWSKSASHSVFSDDDGFHELS